MAQADMEPRRWHWENSPPLRVGPLAANLALNPQQGHEFRTEPQYCHSPAGR
jgi:hypothetical protein